MKFHETRYASCPVQLLLLLMIAAEAHFLVYDAVSYFWQ
jgi:hypothetical protein